jgi:hypothetical protein
MPDQVTIKPGNLQSILSKTIPAKEPVLIVGKPGIGKTEITEQMVNELNYKTIAMYPVVSEPVDFRGMPYTDMENARAMFLPFGSLDDLVRATEPTVCLIDDLGQAMIQTMGAVMHLIQARQIGDHKVSDHVSFVACTNSREHHAGVTGIIEPLKDRFSIVHLEVDVEDWVKWAIQSDIRPEVVGFIRLCGMEMLSNFKPTMDMTKSPTPRGNEAVSRILNLGFKDSQEEFALIQGAVGRGYAVQFAGFKKLFESLVDPGEILKRPETVDIPEDNPSVVYAYCSALSRLVTPENMPAVVQFARRLPIEFQVKLLEYDCKSADPETHETGAYTQWAIDNQQVLKAA